LGNKQIAVQGTVELFERCPNSQYKFFNGFQGILLGIYIGRERERDFKDESALK
jgi:hypothetical protein